MHSWRVLILPYLEQDPLYRRYNFNEPWDGPQNRQLASLAPPQYRCPSMGHFAADGLTDYAVVVGPGTLFDGPVGRRLADVVDGTSNTIAVVEAGQAGLNWLEPRDLDLSQMNAALNAGPGQISSRHSGGAQALMADGSVKFLSDGLRSQDLQSLLSRAGADPVILPQ